MPNFPTSFALAILASYALVFVGPFLLAAAIVILALPALRRRTGLRRTAYGVLATCAVLLVCALPAGVALLDFAPRHSTTHRLNAPRTFGGILFPAGSTIHVWPEDDKVESGTVPSPTVIEGLPLIGDFRFPTGADPVFTGTLATPHNLDGIPCAPGPVRVYGPEVVRCVLAQDYAFEEHLLAAGQDMELYRPSEPLPPGAAYFPPELRFGVLARPEVLFGTSWPAGTVVGGIKASPGQMAGKPWGEVVFCLPDGKTADIGAATLHGFIAYYVRDDYLRVFTQCDLVPERGYDMSGHVQVGPDRFHIGARLDDASPWEWSTETHW